MHIHKLLAGGPGGLAGATRFRQAQAGDRDSLNGLMVEHDGLVQAVVRRQAFRRGPASRPHRSMARHSGL